MERNPLMNFPYTLMNPRLELGREGLKLEETLDHLERILGKEDLRYFGVLRGQGGIERNLKCKISYRA